MNERLSLRERAEALLSEARRRSGCLILERYQDHDGYIRIKVRGKRTRAHRFIAEVLLNDCEPLPLGAVVHHTCSNRNCIEPEHLQITTAQANTAEMLERRSYTETISEQEERLRDRLLEAELENYALRLEVEVLRALLASALTV